MVEIILRTMRLLLAAIERNACGRCQAAWPRFPSIWSYGAVPRIGPVLAAKALAANHKLQLQDMVVAADRVVVVCSWLFEALRANGVSTAKLVLNRQGVQDWPAFEPRNKSKVASGRVRVGFLGRWDPVKGVHILIKSFKCLPAKCPYHARHSGGGRRGHFRPVSRRRPAFRNQRSTHPLSSGSAAFGSCRLSRRA